MYGALVSEYLGMPSEEVASWCRFFHYLGKQYKLGVALKPVAYAYTCI
jgi:hypothetical protein